MLWWSDRPAQGGNRYREEVNGYPTQPMPLTVGSRIGHYDVTALIGEGGMGQVYQATDTKLNRQVALKILPEAFATDPDRLARFQREAQVLASLNHPNIAAIHGIEETDDTRALVLELVEGPTLADRIAKGPIPVDEALPIAKQIAAALEAAHEAGVIHRDLKPANIKVRDDGTVKVLDFGLAKAFQPDASDPGLSQSPTISLTAAATQMGMVIGTAAYMAPEQAKGKVVDKRADVWAFGAVLYEMLAGRKPFVGEDVSDTLAYVLTKEISWEDLPAGTPESIRHLLQRCLERDPRERLRDMGEARIAITTLGSMPVEVAAKTSAAAPGPRLWQTPLAAAAITLVVAVVAGILLWGVTRSPSPRVARFRLSLPDSLGVSPSSGDIAIAPDGAVVYRLIGTGTTDNRWFVRSVDQLDAVSIAGLSGPNDSPFLSPDGAWLGVFDAANGDLKKVPLSGGVPLTVGSIAGLGSVRGASWGEDDTIVFGTSGPSGLWRVSADGGQPEEVTAPDTGTNHVWPDTLPGGQAVLFTILGDDLDAARLAVLDLATGDQHLLERGHAPRYVQTGHVVYAAGGALYAVGFDLDDLATTGLPVQIMQDVLTKPAGAAEFAVAADGTLVYMSGSVPRLGMSTLVWVDRQGQETAVGAPPGSYRWPRVSPDDRQVVVAVQDGTVENVWLYNLARSTLEPLTFGPRNRWPVWSADGAKVIFQSSRGGTLGDLYSMPADRSNEGQILVQGDTLKAPGSFSSDGRLFTFYEVAPDRSRDIWMRGTG